MDSIRDLISQLQNADSILSEFFLVLWSKNNRKSALKDVLIPDTMIYSHGKPVAWFFTASNGELMCKNRNKLNSSAMLHAFKQKHEENVASGYAINIMAKFLTPWRGSPGNLKIDYLDEKGLTAFLLSNHKSDGVLQQFIMPKEEVPGLPRNFTIGMLWSPTCCAFEKQICTTRLPLISKSTTDKDLKIKEEDISTCTYTSLSANIAPVVQQTCTQVANNIARHVYNTHNAYVASLQLQFKIDNNNRLYLLWCTNMRVVDGSLEGPQNSAVPSRSAAVGIFGPYDVRAAPVAQKSKNMELTGHVVRTAAEAMWKSASPNSHGEGELICPLCRTRNPITTMRHIKLKSILQSVKYGWRSHREPYYRNLMEDCDKQRIDKIMKLMSKLASKRVDDSVSQIDTPDYSSADDCTPLASKSMAGSVVGPSLWSRAEMEKPIPRFVTLLAPDTPPEEWEIASDPTRAEAYLNTFRPICHRCLDTLTSTAKVFERSATPVTGDTYTWNPVININKKPKLRNGDLPSPVASVSTIQQGSPHASSPGQSHLADQSFLPTIELSTEESRRVSVMEKVRLTREKIKAAERAAANQRMPAIPTRKDTHSHELSENDSSSEGSADLEAQEARRVRRAQKRKKKARRQKLKEKVSAFLKPIEDEVRGLLLAQQQAKQEAERKRQLKEAQRRQLIEERAQEIRRLKKQQQEALGSSSKYKVTEVSIHVLD